MDEGIDEVSQLFDGGEGSAGEALSLKDREPNLDLVEPGGPRWREVKRHVGMALEPKLVLLVGIQVVEDDMDVLSRIGGDDVVHKAEELAAAAALCVGGVDFAGGDVERAEQRRGAVPGVVVALAGQGASVRQLQIALRPLQRLDRRLGGFGGKLRVVALAPRFARHK